MFTIKSFVYLNLCSYLPRYQDKNVTISSIFTIISCIGYQEIVHVLQFISIKMYLKIEGSHYYFPFLNRFTECRRRPISVYLPINIHVCQIIRFCNLSHNV